MDFAFFGTDEFSVKVLETLKETGLTPSLVITVPDKPKGRKMILTPPLVKVWAEKNRVEVIQPASLRHLEVKPPSDKEPQLGGLTSKFNGKFDFFLVASYGKIIPQDILDIPTHGTINIHPSLLPQYRGPAPLEAAILNGESETGVSIMKLDAEMDHGPLLAQEKIPLADQYNFEQLRDKLAVVGANLIAKIIPAWLAGELKEQAQDHTEATYTKKFTKEDGLINPTDSALINYRKILALNPWPGTYTEYPSPVGPVHLIIKQAHLEGGELVYDRVIPAGKKEMSWTDFLRGFNKS